MRYKRELLVLGLLTVALLAIGIVIEYGTIGQYLSRTGGILPNDSILYADIKNGT